MRLSDSRLAAALAVWTAVVCAIPNVALAITEPLAPCRRLACALLAPALWWLLLSLWARVGRTVLWLFPVMFLAAFQIVLLSLYGRSVIAVDMFLNLVTTNATEVGELLGNMLGAIALVCVLFLPPLVAAVVAVRKRWRLSAAWMRRSRRGALCGLALGLAAFAGGFAEPGPYRPLIDLYPANAVYNAVLAGRRSALTDELARASEAYRTCGSLTADSVAPRTVVLVIGETSRADRWELNGYSRPTSGPLASDTSYISLHRALSESNTTHKSVPLLLTHLDATTFADSIYYVKSLVAAFGDAGYRTAFFSNQRYNSSFIDRFAFEADTTLFIKEADGADHTDADLLPLVAAELRRPEPLKLIVLHTYGSHFSYADRYPQSDALFVPDRPLSAKASNKERLDNAYDNSIRATALLLDSLGRMLAGAPAAMFYTSDHGEDIFDDARGLFLHASPCPSAYQIHVPLVLWMSPDYAAANPAMAAAARKLTDVRVSSSRAFYHTALQLGSVLTPAFDPSESLVSGAYEQRPPLYLNDHNQPVSLPEAGLQQPDLELLAPMLGQ